MRAHQVFGGGGFSASLAAAALTVVLSASAASAATTYYVATDGDDANNGLTRATAKATLAAGYTAMTNGTPETTYGNVLVLGDGEWTFSSAMALSNGWSVAGENGAASTTLRASKEDIRPFDMNSADAEIRDLTVDFRSGEKFNYNNTKGALLGVDALGSVTRCRVVNFRSGWNGTLVSQSTEGRHLDFTDCTFNNCRINYQTAVFLLNGGTADFTRCRFENCYAVHLGDEKHGNYGVVYCTKASWFRNCFFRACQGYGSFLSNARRYSSIVSAEPGAGAVLENCTFLDCTVAGAGGPVANAKLGTAAAATLRNCLVYGCTNNDGAVGFLSGLTCETCASDVDYAGAGVVKLTPGGMVWQCAAEDRLVPSAGPTIDAGTTLSWMADATDLRGNARIAGDAPDIGCFEYHAPKTYYVAKDGDDANDGLSRTSAKATLAAGYALLSGDDDTLVLGDGEWTASFTIVLSNGWSVVSENGRDQTTLLVNAARRLFGLSTAGTLVRGLTIDLKGRNMESVGEGALAKSPNGRLENLTVKNYYTSWGGSLLYVGGTTAPVVSNCVFSGFKVTYQTAPIHVAGSAAPLFTHCSFIDGAVSTRVTYGTIWIDGDSARPVIRNCLLLRCQNNQNCGEYTMYSSGTIHANAKTLIENCSLIDCTFIGNAFGSDDPTFAARCGPIIKAGTVVNTLVYGCRNKNGDLQPCRAGTYTYCASDSELTGENCILLTDANFRFRAPARGDYSVVRGAPRDGGTPRTWTDGATDLLGRPRVFGHGLDIGCFECDVAYGFTVVVQ